MTKPDQKWVATDPNTMELRAGEKVLATVSLYDDGLVAFKGETMELGVEQAGTYEEKVVFLRVPQGQFAVSPIRD